MVEQKEDLKIPEQKVNPQYDAILVHGYWMSEPTPGNITLALRSRLATRAAALAYDYGKGAEKIIVDLGHLWGPSYPSEGSLMAKELKEKYLIPANAIILRENAYSTGGEVKTAIKLARENGWTKVLDIAFSDHQKSIPEIYKEYGGEDLVITKSIEKILEEKDNHLVYHLAKRLDESRYGIVYRRIYEPIKRLRMKMPGFTYDSLEAANKKSRMNKGHDSPLPWPLRFDVYKL